MALPLPAKNQDAAFAPLVFIILRYNKNTRLFQHEPRPLLGRFDCWAPADATGEELACVECVHTFVSLGRQPRHFLDTECDCKGTSGFGIDEPWIGTANDNSSSCLLS